MIRSCEGENTKHVLYYIILSSPFSLAEGDEFQELGKYAILTNASGDYCFLVCVFQKSQTNKQKTAFAQ